MSTKTPVLLLTTLFGWAAGLFAQTGLKGEYFTGTDFTTKVLTRIDSKIDFVWYRTAPAPGLDPEVYSIRWTGKINTPETGNYLFRANVDDGIRVWVNNRLVIDAWGLHDTGQFRGEIALTGGREYNFQVEYFNAMLEGEVQVFWQLPSEAPVFGGLLGYNDKLIEARFFTQPPAPPTAAITPPATPAKPVTKPATKPATKPVAKPVTKTANIARDTLAKYLPENVLFVKSQSVILPESKPALDNLAAFLLRNPRYNLLIEGHTDRIGNAEKNLQLSQDRAAKVAAHLIEKGVNSSRITTKGYGDTRPLVVEAPNVPNARNRRVAFTILE
jgi:outer membrane protein OmpA-like peptidoglycan-associated protein